MKNPPPTPLPATQGIRGEGEPGLNSIQKSIITSEVIEAIRTVYDPEIPVNIHDLGLIYSVNVASGGSVQVKPLGHVVTSPLIASW